MRGLSEKFMQSLNNGELKCFLEAVKQDDTLCLSIREDYINIYYRGGNIFRIEKSSQGYRVQFDLNYSDLYKGKLEAIDRTDYSGWCEHIPIMKTEMDFWFAKHPKTEREFQQVILRENNFSSITNDTDYYIADIEYADGKNKSRFDMLAVKWLSTSAARRSGTTRLAFIEVKYGDGALQGESGLKAHFTDMYRFLSSSKKKYDVCKEIETIFNQQRTLGLIKDTRRDIVVDDKQNPEFILIFANHKPVSKVLHRELSDIYGNDEYQQLKSLCDVKVAKSSCMGYGLYQDCIIPLEEYLGTSK